MIEWFWWGIEVLGIIGLGFLALLGAFVLFHTLRPQHAPADRSNRINALRLLWFALTREELFVDVFPWLKNDELENVTRVKNSMKNEKR